MPRKRKRAAREISQISNDSKKQKTQRNAIINLLPHLKEQQQAITASNTEDTQATIIHRQSNWLSQKELNLNSESFMLDGYHEYLSGDTGASGFLAPKGVVKKATSIDESDVIEYTSSKPDNDQLKIIQNFLRQEDLLARNQSIVDSTKKEAQYDLVIGNGTQQILDEIFKQVKVTDGDMIVCPVPTYGLVFKSMNAAGLDIAFYPLEKPDYKIKPEGMVNFIKEKNHELALLHAEMIEDKRDYFMSLVSPDPLKKYDTNEINRINNLVNQLLSFTTNAGTDSEGYLVNSDKLTREINSRISNIVKSHCEINSSLFLKEHPHLKKQREERLVNSIKIPLCPRVRAIFHVNPNNPMGSILNQDDTSELANLLISLNDKNLQVIEDLTHKDILMGNTRPGLFSKTVFWQQTVTLVSLSKSYGLAGFRVGLAIGRKEQIAKLNERFFDSQLMLNVPAMKALLAICSMKPSTRRNYLSGINSQYQYRRTLVKAIIDGLDSINSQDNRNKITQSINDAELIKYETDLMSGIKDVTLTNESQGGFFVNLDFSKLLGCYVGDLKLKNGFDFQRLFYYLADVNMLPNELNGELNSPSLRFSLSLDEEEILQAFARIKKVLSWISPQSNPELALPSTLTANPSFTTLTEDLYSDLNASVASSSAASSSSSKSTTTSSSQKASIFSNGFFASGEQEYRNKKDNKLINSGNSHFQFPLR